MAESSKAGTELRNDGRRHGTGKALPASLRKMIASVAKDIRTKHGLLDRKTADRVARLLKTSVAPRKRPGRPISPEVLRACELRNEGLSWPKVYSEVIPGYWKLEYPERFWRATRLRDAVRAHRRRRGQTAGPKRTPKEKP